MLFKMNLKIYQSFFSQEQMALLERSFIPYNNLKNTNPELSEYPLILDLYSKNKNYDGYWGMMSWRFREKTNTSGEEFIKMIRRSMTHDVYHFNPFYEENTKYPNPFVQGEVHHPGMVNYTNRLLELMGYKIDIRNEIFDKEHFVYCSYYVGNQRFWEQWMAFQDAAMTISNKDQDLNVYLYHTYTNNRGRNMINFSFLIERLVGLFLHLYKDEYKTKGFK